MEILSLFSSFFLCAKLAEKGLRDALGLSEGASDTPQQQQLSLLEIAAALVAWGEKNEMDSRVFF